MCQHRWIIELGETVCELCGHCSGEFEEIDEYREHMLIRRHLHYQPLEFIDKKCKALAGHDEEWTRSGLVDIELVRAELGKAQTWFEVYERLVGLSMEKYLLSVPAMMGYGVYLGDYCKAAHEVIYTQGFKLKFCYFCFKWCEMQGHTDLWIPVKCRRATHQRNEAEWKRVCEFYGVPCRPTRYEVLRTPWAQSV